MGCHPSNTNRERERESECAACSIISVLTQWGATLVIKIRERESLDTVPSAPHSLTKNNGHDTYSIREQMYERHGGPEAPRGTSPQAEAAAEKELLVSWIKLMCPRTPLPRPPASVW